MQGAQALQSLAAMTPVTHVCPALQQSQIPHRRLAAPLSSCVSPCTHSSASEVRYCAYAAALGVAAHGSLSAALLLPLCESLLKSVASSSERCSPLASPRCANAAHGPCCSTSPPTHGPLIVQVLNPGMLRPTIIAGGAAHAPDATCPHLSSTPQ